MVCGIALDVAGMFCLSHVALQDTAYVVLSCIVFSLLGFITLYMSFFLYVSASFYCLSLFFVDLIFCMDFLSLGGTQYIECSIHLP